MLFTSMAFLFRFLPVALLLYYLCPAKCKNIALLAISLAFGFLHNFMFLPVALAMAVANWLCGLALGKPAKRGRRLVLALAIFFNLGLLVFYKYGAALAGAANSLLGLALPAAEGIIAPLGLAVMALQATGYCVDIYRKTTPAEKNPLTFAAYLTLFAPLYAGPLTGYAALREPLHLGRGRATLAGIEKGIEAFILGLAAKVLLADGIGLLWTDVVGKYENGSLVYNGEGIGLQSISTPLAWLALAAFGLQLYFALAGYGLMAKGLGGMLGFTLPQNFSLPYCATSVTGFLQRWFISLTNWLTNYLYRPLAGTRGGLRPILALLAACLLGGLWYGASAGFALWGLYLFALLLAEKLFLGKWLQKGRVWPHIYTLLAVFVGWALFAGGNPGVAAPTLLAKLFIPQGGVGALYFARNYAVILLLGGLFCTPLPQKLYAKIQPHTALKTIVLALLFAGCVAYLVAGSASVLPYLNL